MTPVPNLICRVRSMSVAMKTSGAVIGSVLAV